MRLCVERAVKILYALPTFLASPRLAGANIRARAIYSCDCLLIVEHGSIH